MKKISYFFVLAAYTMVWQISMSYLRKTDCNIPFVDVTDISIAASSSGSSCKSCIPKLGLRPLKNRDELLDLVQEHGFTTAIEIGVKAGNFAMHFLKSWKTLKKYHLVDLWAHQKNYIDASNGNDARHEKMYETTRRRLKPWEDKTEFHRMLSTEAAKGFEKESIDFIYIDARHDYCGVMEDIEHYWPILKPGGIMAGHDYNDNIEIGTRQDWGLCQDGTRNDMAVKGAVNDFFVPKGYTISVTYYREENWMSWIVQKRLC